MQTTTPIYEQLLDIAEQLIYQHGIHATGIDLLVKTSGISRKTIYRYFANKEALCAAALERRDRRWMAWLARESQADDPHGRILALFSALKKWFGSDDFRGCAFINTAGEISDPSHPLRHIARDHKNNLKTFITGLCREANVVDCDIMASQLLLLIDGAITVAMVMNDVSAADDAQQIARRLLAPV
ncbi:TetR/AcrR family transcriptional regulator [Erwinia oleae]|uniref:TetR/AcrR family transcriptional regulator n=1 Tax=Erwinia oleae TaxID=796334 RepID=UPI00055316FB|nr:TetR family transcriptional regulator [Erwinia oleae]